MAVVSEPIWGARGLRAVNVIGSYDGIAVKADLAQIPTDCGMSNCMEVPLIGLTAGYIDGEVVVGKLVFDDAADSVELLAFEGQGEAQLFVTDSSVVLSPKQFGTEVPSLCDQLQ